MPRRTFLFPSRSALLAALLATACLTFTFIGVAHAAAGPTVPATPPKTRARLLLVGLDGADWQIASPLIAAGRLPNLAKLQAGGAWSDLRSATPMLSPLLWTSIATGKTPDQHGIIDFLVRDPHTAQDVPISSTFRKTKAIWNIYSDAGLTSDFIGWWATWPAETIRGHMVSDRVAYSLFGYSSRPEDAIGLVSPPAFLGTIKPLRVDESDITLNDLKRFAPITQSDLSAARASLKGEPARAYADPINHLSRILASTRTYHNIALKLLRDGKPDILSVYYQAIDETCHRYAQYIAPKPDWVDAAAFQKYKDVVTRMYEYQDELLGQLLKAAGPGVTLMVVSDHGFLSGSNRPDFPPDIELKAGMWHRMYGIWLLHGPSIRPGKLPPVSLYDVMPTLLYLSGLSVPLDGAGRPVLDAIAAEFQAAHPLTTVPTWEDPNGRSTGPAQAQGYSPAVDEEILARLRSLGYIAGRDISPKAKAGEDEAPATLTNMINMATLELQKGDLKASEEIVRSILARKPDHGESHQLLSEILSRQGRYDEALTEARTALNLIEVSPERLVEQYARLARRQGSLDDAKAWFLRATQIRSGRAEPWLGLGIAQSLAGESAAALRSFQRALEMNPRSVGAATGLHNLFDAGVRSQEVIEGIEKAAAANPDSAAHRTLLGLTYASLNDDRRASAELRRALELDPDHDAAIAATGKMMLKQGRIEEARRMMEAAVARKGDLAETRLSLGQIYARSGRFGEAAQQTAEALRLQPDSASANAQMGMITMMQEIKPESAIENMRRALELDPSMYELRLHLAILYHDQKRLPECEAALKGAIEARPDDPEPYRLLGSLYTEMGRREEAEEVMTRLRGLKPRP